MILNNTSLLLPKFNCFLALMTKCLDDSQVYVLSTSHWHVNNQCLMSYIDFANHLQICKKYADGTRLVFTSKRMLPVACKDVLLTIQKSVVIYEYKCHCDSRYVGRTSQRLQDRIKQHVPQ